LFIRSAGCAAHPKTADCKPFANGRIGRPQPRHEADPRPDRRRGVSGRFGRILTLALALAYRAERGARGSTLS
jgi:hypothetical protein